MGDCVFMSGAKNLEMWEIESVFDLSKECDGRVKSDRSGDLNDPCPQRLSESKSADHYLRPYSSSHHSKDWPFLGVELSIAMCHPIS
jgi:hypothetical protein